MCKTKVCSTCGIQKDLDLFVKNTNTCNSCRNERQNKLNRENRHQFINWCKEYNTSVTSKESKNKFKEYKNDCRKKELDEIAKKNTKVCSKCNEEKCFDMFPKAGFICKCCKYAATSIWRKENRDMLNKQNKKWRQENRDKFLDMTKRNYAKNRDSILRYQKIYAQKNKDIISGRYRKNREENLDVIKKKESEYRHKNKERILEYMKKYRQESKEKIELRRKKYCEENREKIAVRMKKYKQENKDEHSLSSFLKRNGLKKELVDQNACNAITAILKTKRVLIKKVNN